MPVAAFAHKRQMHSDNLCTKFGHRQDTGPAAIEVRSLANSQQQQQAAGEWPMDGMEHSLAASFEGSLSGLGVDLSTASFSMSDAMMSLSPGKFAAAAAAASEAGGSSGYSGVQQQMKLLGGGVSGEHAGSADCGKFSVSLSASTSPAVKINEEPLTYLNQGQPYELKLSFYGHGEKAQLFRSVLRVSFHERRMQFMEREHLDYWRQSRPGERILDVDVPLSYNVRRVHVSPERINAAEVVWEGGGASVGGNGGGCGSDCGVFVKLHCISTEFTARKHGGEKGVPFRLQVDTFDQASGEHLCSVAAQVKVFKPKGADRKHKTDREKVERRAESERSKYQPALPHTPFRPAPFAAEAAATAATAASPTVPAAPGPGPLLVKAEPKLSTNGGVVVVKQESAPAAISPKSSVPAHSPAAAAAAGSPAAAAAGATLAAAAAADETQQHLAGATVTDELTLGSSPRQVAAWLERNRFGAGLTRQFANYCGADLLRLSRADLLDICGAADGVRLYNSLVRRPCRSRLVFFVGQESESVFHPVYLNSLTYLELLAKVSGLFQSDGEKISQILLYGPGGIPVCISDEMVSHLDAESRFSLHVLPDPATGDRFRIFMKPLPTAALAAAAAAAASSCVTNGH